MKEINIARTIAYKRKEKGLTQDDLAYYLGVSKASVSKWETGQSFPDITFLPLLAAYFNISIDELMGYEPQMSKEDIRRLYHELSDDFVSKPYDEALERCRGIAKKYFSCFQLLYYIGVLLINYSSLAGDNEKTVSVLTEAKMLSARVKAESDDTDLARQALSMEAVCAHMLGNPGEILELLGETIKPIISSEPLLAAAYHITGRIKEAKTVLQVGMHQHLLALFGIAPSYLMLYADDEERFDEAYRRTASLAEIFNLKELHPSVILNFYLAAAQGYTAAGNTDKALEMLENYAETATGNIYPMQLKGDGFFDLIDDWIDESVLGAELPRDEKSVRQDMYYAIADNPAFSALSEEQRFKSTAERLKNNCQGEF